jgi:hypothetical protein
MKTHALSGTLAIAERLKRDGIYHPDKVQFVEIQVPPECNVPQSCSAP